MTESRPSGGRRTPAIRFTPRWALGGYPLLLAAAAVLFSCTDNAPTRVVGSEIGNPTIALTGMATYPNGQAAGGARVLLRKQAYLAEDKAAKLLSSMSKPGQAKISVSLANVFTDSSGRFRIDSVDDGDYRIEINDGQNQGLLIDCSVKAKKGVKDTVFAASALSAHGSVRGVVQWDAAPQSPYLALLYGMERVALVDPVTGGFSMDDLPPGTYTFKVGCLGRGCLSQDVENVIVAAGGETLIDTVSLASFEAEDYATWTHSERLEMNTTEAGTALADTLFNFPLLVRLNAGNFDFSQADGRGRDIRFASFTGRHLHYDIERWDDVEKQAEIWVRVDTLFGDNAAQALTMHWGNPTASFYTGGTQVFGAKEGYRGVWHLSEEGSSTPNGFRDVSGNGNHGTGQGISPVSSHAGVTGQGLNFDGSTSLQVEADSTLHAKDSLTLEFWVNFTALGPFKRIVSKAHVTANAPWTEYDIELDATGTKVAFSVALGGTLYSVKSATNPAAGEWYHVVGTYDGLDLRIYINGSQEAVTPKAGVITDYGRGLTFGKYEFDSASNFRGQIDEVRVSAETRSSAWIKLSYENQRTGSVFPALKP